MNFVGTIGLGVLRPVDIVDDGELVVATFKIEGKAKRYKPIDPVPSLATNRFCLGATGTIHAIEAIN